MLQNTQSLFQPRKTNTVAAWTAKHASDHYNPSCRACLHGRPRAVVQAAAAEASTEAAAAYTGATRQRRDAPQAAHWRGAVGEP